MVHIHSALLPKYGGKGIYGSFLHKWVKASDETKTGTTIHLVNEHYKEGKSSFMPARLSVPKMPLIGSQTKSMRRSMSISRR
jgi:phosphoribosylglycinamide formyltransferase-1